jgi:thioredoxin
MGDLDTKFNALVMIVLCGVGYMLIGRAREPVGPPNDAWFESAVIAQHEPVLVKFGAEWCGPCRMLEGQLDQFSQAARGRVAVVRIDVGRHPELARHYGVSSIPRLLLFDHGRVIGDRVGYANHQQLESWVASKMH